MSPKKTPKAVPESDPADLVTKPELARRLRLSQRSVEKLLGEGLPTVRFPGLRTVRFRPRDVDLWLNDYQRRGTIR